MPQGQAWGWGTQAAGNLPTPAAPCVPAPGHRSHPEQQVNDEMPTFFSDRAPGEDLR